MASLALLGGSKTIQEPLGREWPIVTDGERRLLLEALESGRWLRAQYPDQHESMAYRFERAFAEAFGVEHAVVVTTGTASLECALKAVGVEAGHEVIVPATTFVATATAVVACNAVPIFADIDPDTYTIDPADVARRITPQTRAIIGVDFGGMPFNRDALLEIARSRGLALIGDCSHSHGSQWKGQFVGSVEDLGCFSIMGGKILPVGEGGVVTTNDDDLALCVESFQYRHRWDDAPYQPYRQGASNYRLSEFNCAIGIAQLEHFEEHSRARVENAQYLIEGLTEIDGLEPLSVDDRVTRWNFYRWHFRFISGGFGGIHRDTFLKALQAEGQPCSCGPTTPLYRIPIFARMMFGETGCPVRCPLYGKQVDYVEWDCPTAEYIHREEAVCLNQPSFLGPRSDMDLLLEALRKIRASVDELRQYERDHPRPATDRRQVAT